MSPVFAATLQAEPSSSLSWVVEAASFQVSLLCPPPSACYQHKEPEEGPFNTSIRSHYFFILITLLVPISLHTEAKVLSVAHEDPAQSASIASHPHYPLSSSSSHSAPAALGFSLHLEYFRQVSTSGPSHLLSGMLFSPKLLNPFPHRQDFTPMSSGPYLQFQHSPNTSCSLSSI